MSIVPEIRAYLIAAGSPVAAQLADRLFPSVLPQGVAYPAGTLERAAGSTQHTLDGPSGREVWRLTVQTWAATSLAAQALAHSVRNRLDGFKGTLAGIGSPSTTIRATIRLENEHESYDETVKKYRTIQEFRVTHTES